ncbi:MAG TPA: glycosyltransferase family 61 protein [Candidatus Saccharimonadales bacterium]|nr:glycosyltransferase family 61 protein [Candidatus Saccharimonadales bacterium]
MSVCTKMNVIITLILTPLCIQTNLWFDVVPLQELLKQDPSITYQKCFDAFSFDFKPFPLSINPDTHPNQGTFAETFIVTIPNGRVQSEYGFVLSNNHFIKELMWKGIEVHLNLVQKIPDNQIIKVSGRVAVITQLAYFTYWHWISEVLCRLALLELAGIEYDYLYVPQSSHFMKETLQMWGIPSEKIISPTHGAFCIQAEQLIVPSFVSNVNFGCVLFSCYAQPHLLQYVKEKLSTAAHHITPTIPLHKRVCISRKDTAHRRIINEERVFELFKEQDFHSYELDKMSVAEQILLFENADIIVSPQGSCLTNSIFCTQKTKLIELFQGLNDATFWYLSQALGLTYTPIKTTSFVPDYVAALKNNTYMPLYIIKKVIENLQKEDFTQ